MGGLAIKNAHTRRYAKDEFEAILPEIQTKLRKKFADAVSTTYYRKKETFGDADFIVLDSATPDHSDLEQWIYDEFGSKEVVPNKGVFSFEYKELQVDLILTPPENWETAKTYFSWNDLHNMVGKVAKKFNLKWGFDGLIYVYRAEGKVLGEIVVSKDYEQSLAFLGFDVEMYNEGFDTLDEIFDFITRSQYFNPWMFDMDQLNRINRERDKKRTTYQSFLRHVDPMKDAGRDAYHYFHKDKDVYLGLIDHYFHGFLLKYRELQLKEERRQKVHSLFNGNLLMAKFPDLSGKSLGEFMTDFQSEFGNKTNFEDWLLATDDVEMVMGTAMMFKNMKFNK